MHVDAAWGGLELLLDEFGPLLSGIDKADSLTWDAHKISPVPMGAGMFFARSQPDAARAFGVEASHFEKAQGGIIPRITGTAIVTGRVSRAQLREWQLPVL